MALRSSIGVGVWVLALAACASPLPPEGSYYEERIAPMLDPSCTRNTTGCHLVDERGSAAGNLDLSSYDSLRRRTDLLVPYGPYSRSLLLLKASAPIRISVDTLDPPDPTEPDRRSVMIETDIRHAADSPMAEGSQAFARLQQWLNDGFTRTGLPDEQSVESQGECVSGPGIATGFSATVVPDPELFDRFVAEAQSTLVSACAGSSCHGASLADLHLSCGETEAEQRWNYWIALQHLSEDPERSELLQRPLATSRGGAFHGGGDTFATADDPGYRALLAWARTVSSSAPDLVRDADPSDGYRYFVNRVQPVMVRKGCMALACHSPISTAFNLRGGARGSFSRFARARNYEQSRARLAIESADANQSRIIAKNLFAGSGITHRGGPLFEDFGSVGTLPSDCDVIDADAGDLNEIPAYCVFVRWHQIEREDAIALGELDATPLRAVAWIRRPVDAAPVGDFDTYRPGADLLVADATLDDVGAVSLGAPRSVLAACGLDAATTDARNPAADWDGSSLAFAARDSRAAPLRLWRFDLATDTCEPLDVQSGPDEVDGILTHDFDPAFAPDGRVVFASTRGSSHGRPTRTPASLEPNSDLYVASMDGTVRQLTFLLDQELSPGFMMDGRVIYTAEKRGLDFHMFSLRRQNLDGGDYHPLYASRHSLGFSAANEVEQLPDQNFVFVAGSLHTPSGAGSIAVFNRTIGPDQSDRDPGDRGYLHSMSLPARGAHHGGRGLYRSPSPLPSGRVLVSCAPDVTDPDAVDVDFDLCELDPRRETLRRITGEPGLAETEVIAVWRRLDRGVLVSDGGGIDRPTVLPGERDAVVHFNDFPMIQSLMFTNTRTGRPVDDRIGGFDVLANQPPPAGTTSFSEVAAGVVEDSFGQFFSQQTALGWVPLFDDGSTRMRVPGGRALSFRMTDGAGEPLEMRSDMPMSGPLVQREHEQYYPGERIQRSIPRRFFNGVCGGCHGSMSGRELDVTVNLDVISGASINAARDAEPFDLMER